VCVCVFIFLEIVSRPKPVFAGVTTDRNILCYVNCNNTRRYFPGSFLLSSYRHSVAFISDTFCVAD